MRLLLTSLGHEICIGHLKPSKAYILLYQTFLKIQRAAPCWVLKKSEDLVRPIRGRHGVHAFNNIVLLILIKKKKRVQEGGMQRRTWRMKKYWEWTREQETDRELQTYKGHTVHKKRQGHGKIADKEP